MKGKAEKEIGELQAKLTIAQDDMRATKDALADKEKELIAIHESLRKSEGKSADLGKQLSAAQAKAKEERKHEQQSEKQRKKETHREKKQQNEL